MREMMIECEWHRDRKGYEIIPAGFGRPQRVVGLGGTVENYRPLRKVDNLFQIFANQATTPEGVFAFIKEFGPLNHREPGPDQGDEVPAVIEAANHMREVVAAHADGKLIPSPPLTLSLFLATVRVNLQSDPITKQLSLYFGGPSLLEALWLQLGKFLMGGGNLKSCRQCGNLFESGPGTGRRADARFCSDEHRVAFNSFKRTRRTNHA